MIGKMTRIKILIFTLYLLYISDTPPGVSLYLFIRNYNVYY